MRYVGIALVQAVALHVRPADAGRDVQVPPDAARSTRSTRSASTASSRARVFAGWRLLRCNPWSHGGVDRAEDARLGAPPRDGAPGVICLLPARVHEPAAAARALPPARPRLVARDGRLLVGLVDRRPHGDRADPARPDHGQADPLDAEPAGARAGDEGDPAEVEARQAAPERRADEVLQGEQDQPGRLVPADRPPDPDLHLAVLRAAALRRAGAAALRRLGRLAPPRRHHRAGEGRLGPAAPRHLRGEPAVVVVLHVDDDAGRAARSS